MNKLIYISLICLIVLPNISAIIISEVMYAPTQSEYYNEWIEIYNNGTNDINLEDWSLCGQNILSGYIDHSDNNELKLNESMILETGKYAIITDGGSGTEVYSNFNVENSTALHVSGSTLCSGLSNSGENITLKDENGDVINIMSYDPSMGALDNDNSLQFDGYWCEELPTPGALNNCPANTQESNSYQENNGTIGTNNNSNQNNSLDSIINNSENITSNYQKILDKGEKIPTATIVLDNAKDIKTEENKNKIDKNDYIIYGLILFGLLMTLLFLLKKKKFENEFR